MQPPERDVAIRIAAEIDERGPMRFDRFMELALYAPGGYYEGVPVGTGSDTDFATSPHVHPIFGWFVAQAIAELAALVEQETTDRVALVEAGAGDGTLLREVLEGLPEAARAVAVERSRQARRALDLLHGVDVLTSLDGVDGPAVVLAHELLDNLPFRRLRGTGPDGAGAREIAVVRDDDAFAETLVPVPDLEELRDLLTTVPSPDEETIVPTGAAAFVIDALADRLGARSGGGPRALLAIDYGADAGSGGPVHGYARHRIVEDVLHRPGRHDITAGVDFGALARSARAAGLAASPTVSQHEALRALGFEAWAGTMLERQRDLLATGRGAGAVRVWGERSSAAMLVDPAGFGRFRWFVVTTPGMPEPEWLRAARAR